MTRRKVLWSIVLLAITSSIAVRRAAAAVDPKQVVTEFGNNALQMLAEPNLSQVQRQQRFRQLLDEYFDFPAIARFVLGRYWNAANDAQRRQFTDAFENYVVAVYSARFADFVGTTFKVTSEFHPGSDVTVVRTDVNQHNGGQPAHVDWRVSEANGQNKITEVSIDGVAMSLTHRQEFAQVLESNGGDINALITKIEARTTSPQK